MVNKWTTTSLKDLGIKLIDCDHKTPKAVDNGIPYIGIPQMDNGRINFDANPRLISEEDFIKWTRKADPKYGDVILSRRCNSGETVYVPKNSKFALGQNLVLLRPTDDRIHPEYLRWVVHGYEWWNEVAKYLNPGAIFESLKCADIPKFKIPEPPKRDQIKISEVLSAISDKIELNHQSNQTLEQMAQALFKSWFIDFDPVIDNALDAGTQVNDFPEALQHRALLRKDSRKQAELLNEYKPLPDDIRALFPSEFEQTDEPSIGIGGCIPKGWKVSNVGTGFNVTMGQSPPSSTYNEMGNGMPFYQGKTDFGFRFPCYRIFCTAPKRLANEGDTLVSVRAPVGDVNLAKDNCAIGRGIAAVRHKIGAISFTYYSLKELERYFKRYEGEGTVFGSINQKDFNKLPFIIPSDEIIKSFEKIASSLDEKLALNAQNISELEKLRDTLLPKLISGELQIPEEKATNKDVV